MPRRYPEYTPERIKESKSYQVLLPKFNARRWAFGSSEWQDHGVDYSFEYVQDGFFHGFRLLGQVKGSSHLKFGNADGQYTKELWIDRRENSKSLAWSSVLLALNNIKEVGAVVDRPKALGDIRGVTYIYGMFYRFGLIDMPDKVNGKMKRAGRQM